MRHRLLPISQKTLRRGPAALLAAILGLSVLAGCQTGPQHANESCTVRAKELGFCDASGVPADSQ